MDSWLIRSHPYLLIASFIPAGRLAENPAEPEAVLLPHKSWKASGTCPWEHQCPQHCTLTAELWPAQFPMQQEQSWLQML